MLGNGYGVVWVVIVSPHQSQVQSTQHSAKYDAKELEALDIVDHCHLGYGNGDYSAISLPSGMEDQGFVSDLLGEVEGAPIKCSSLAQHLRMVHQHTKTVVFTLYHWTVQGESLTITILLMWDHLLKGHSILIHSLTLALKIQVVRIQGNSKKKPHIVHHTVDGPKHTLTFLPSLLSWLLPPSLWMW